MIYIGFLTVVNLIVFFTSVYLVLLSGRKCWILPVSKKDKVFYQLKLKKCIVFLIYNSIAMYVNYRLFSDLDLMNRFPTDLLFLRYLERAVTLIYAGLKMLDCCRFYPSAYDK